jgi:[ribosomal protein S5]-alanine N-acetyltransferase
MRRGELLKLWIFGKSDSAYSRIIGVISFSQIIEGCFLSCFLGYSIDASETGKGYMTEALDTAIRYVFDSVRLHRIEANIQPENAPSLRVAQKLGFREEGLARKYLKIDSKWHDHLHMVILNSAVE